MSRGTKRPAPFKLSNVSQVKLVVGWTDGEGAKARKQAIRDVLYAAGLHVYDVNDEQSMWMWWVCPNKLKAIETALDALEGVDYTRTEVMMRDYSQRVLESGDLPTKDSAKNIEGGARSHFAVEWTPPCDPDKARALENEAMCVVGEADAETYCGLSAGIRAFDVFPNGTWRKRVCCTIPSDRADGLYKRLYEMLSRLNATIKRETTSCETTYVLDGVPQPQP